MKNKILSRTLSLTLCFLAALTPVFGQDAVPTPAPPIGQDEEVLKVSTELVQTDVTVLDKKGQFVRDLHANDFELRIDGRVQPITFFELVTSAPGAREQQRGARTAGASTPAVAPAVPVGVERGRTLLFFVDNVHVAPDTMARTRKMLSEMIEDEVGINDQAMISATFNQIGFLQQLTDNKAVLRAAIKRLVSRNFASLDPERLGMTDYNAFKMIDLGDQNLFDYFVGEYMKINGVDRRMAEPAVTQIAERKLALAAASAESTLSTLERVVRSLRPLPGRKVLFFISDGFLMQTQRADINVRLRRVADAAAHNNTVIYSLDAKGLATDPFFDASRSQNFDPAGTLARASMGEISAGQDPLYTLAADTGGRALFNSNDLGAQVTRALNESSTYYLLAWTPAVEEQRGGKFRRLEVRVKNRPDLKVLVRKGFFNGTPPLLAEGKRKTVDQQATTSKATTPDAMLRSAIGSLYPSRALTVSLSAGFVGSPGGGLLLVSTVGFDRSALSTDEGGGARGADIAQVLFNDEGKVITSVKQQLSVTPPKADGSDESSLVFQHTFPLTPGLYQLRVAARDRQSGRTGGASEWIEVPDIKAGEFALGSVFIGGRALTPSSPVRLTPSSLAGESANAAPVPPPPLNDAGATIATSADHRFPNNLQLRFLTTVYNPALRDSVPDVLLRIQVLRDGRTPVTSVTRKLTPDRTDLTRISYAAGLPLTGLQRGQYLLVVSAEDRLAKKTSEQKVKFYIE